MKKHVIGVDLGGTKITTAISDLEGAVIERTTLSTDAHLGESSVMEKIFLSIEKVLDASGVKKDDVRAIGIGSPGPLDSEKGIIITTPNLPFRRFDVVAPVRERFGIETYLDNDANAAALGEFTFGAGRGTKNMIYITVSTGVGGGAVLNGRPYRGSTSNALEVGHMTIEPFSRHQCNCGKFGDVEALSSGTSIAKRAREAVAEGTETSLKDVEEITSYAVYEAYLKGDSTAKEILENAFMYLGIGIANLIVNFDPEVIVIGGGVSKIGDFFFDSVKASARERSFDFMFDGVKIVPAELGQEAGVQGALALALIESENAV